MSRESQDVIRWRTAVVRVVHEAMQAARTGQVYIGGMRLLPSEALARIPGQLNGYARAIRKHERAKGKR